MASREHQVWQGALIVFVLLTIFLAVATFGYYKSSETQWNRATAAEQEAQKARSERDQALQDNQRLKEMMGFDIADSMEVVEKRFNEDMALFGADYPEGDPKNYRTLPEYLLTAAINRSTMVVEAESRENEALRQKTATEQRLTEEKNNLQQSFDALTQDYAAERKTLADDRNRIVGESQTLLTNLRAKEQQIAAVQNQAAQELQQKDDEIKQLQDTLENFINQKRESEQVNFDAAAGRITFVNQADRTVWIDLGLADGLQRHTTFSVYDQNVHQFSPEEVKAKIEVTKLAGRHLAEARILEDDLRNPIIPGDLIYTPAWRPGVFQHFAIAGFIDVNEDGIEDKELLRNLILANGGVIDAEVDATGNMVGEGISANTRYLIVGQRPDEAMGRRDPAAMEAWNALYEEAGRFGVEIMPLPRFLALMGYRGGAVTVQLGARGADQPAADAAQRPGAAAGNNGAAPPANGAGGAAADAPFRPRLPARGEAGAF